MPIGHYSSFDYFDHLLVGYSLKLLVELEVKKCGKVFELEQMIDPIGNLVRGKEQNLHFDHHKHKDYYVNQQKHNLYMHYLEID